ncbi:MAG: hypothetical protein KC419_24815 [Anaerolineales bacterium]|nr:hypothetical protein [Anaerolineales bacterium]
MFAEPPQYKTYILRIWEERDSVVESPTRWRFSITDPTTNHRHGFTNLRDLCQFLELDLDPNEDEHFVES